MNHRCSNINQQLQNNSFQNIQNEPYQKIQNYLKLVSKPKATKKQIEESLYEMNNQLCKCQRPNRKQYLEEVKFILHSKKILIENTQQCNKIYVKIQSIPKQSIKKKFQSLDLEVRESKSKLEMIKSKHSLRQRKYFSNRNQGIDEDNEDKMIESKICILKNCESTNGENVIIGQVRKKIKSFLSNNSNLSHRMREYIICYIIMDKLLSLISQDTRNIRLKQNNQQLYQEIKYTMVSSMVNQNKTFGGKLNTINNNFRRKPLKFKTINKLNHLKEQPTLLQQIEHNFHNAAKYLNTAIQDLNRPDLLFYPAKQFQ